MTEWRPSFPKMSEVITVTDEKKLLSALGLCARARKITVGVPMICDAMKKGGKDAILAALGGDVCQTGFKRLLK